MDQPVLLRIALHPFERRHFRRAVGEQIVLDSSDALGRGENVRPRHITCRTTARGDSRPADPPSAAGIRRMVQKLDLGENTRYRQAGFEGTMETFRAISPSCNVVLRRRLGHPDLCRNRL